MADAFAQTWADLEGRAATLIKRCTAQGLMLATAESCTGGLVAAILTEIAGSSAVVDRAFVTYSNAAKTEMLGVPARLITAHGAVSAEVALAMAAGALSHAAADLAVAITGIAGPGGGSAEKPVGLVHFALARRKAPIQGLHRLFGPIGRQAIRFAAVAQAFDLIAANLG
jgi:nicotinamide-nucleotide amidase